MVFAAAGVVSCTKESAPKETVIAPPVFPPAQNPSFVEEFDNVGDLVSKGWVLRNNSNPIGTTGWRQGRYEPATTAQYKFLGPTPFVGFPAYSANTSPNDFISCDVTAVSDATWLGGIYSAWLISPKVPISNGDQLVFWTRAVDDSYYPVYTKDRMQVYVNYTDGTANVGASATSLGSFTTKVLDINQDYIYNDPSGNTPAVAGYPRDWTKYTITFNNVPGGTAQNARFAFRYHGTDAGLSGGPAGANFPTVVGIDSLAFIKK